MSATIVLAPTRARASRVAVLENLAPGHWRDEAHAPTAGGFTLPPTRTNPTPEEDTSAASTAERDSSQGRTDAQSSRAAVALLRIAADTLNDVEGVRIATENRLRAWDQDGLPAGPERQRAQLLLDALAATEHQAALDLKRALRKHPLGGWVRQTVGIGEKQGARLLAAIGDPYWNSAEDRPRRGPAELWAYCGYHTLPAGGHMSTDPQADHVPGGNIAAKRQRGQRANWNAEAKMRAFLCAEACIKQRHSPYRAVYDSARVKHADAVHAHPCVRCGPSGHPAPAGSPLSDGHKHARALREVAKRILRDLYLTAKEAA